uniref:UBC core domain-containing protein n=1 Tax=Setaria italica TaxID=4555 RepID=K3YY87_SETIT
QNRQPAAVLFKLPLFHTYKPRWSTHHCASVACGGLEGLAPYGWGRAFPPEQSAQGFRLQSTAACRRGSDGRLTVVPDQGGAVLHAADPEELYRLWVDPPAFCRPGPSPVIIDGPDGTPYAGGTFPIDIRFTADHPIEPPNIAFKTKMVLDIFREKWSPALTIEKLLLSIVSVLHDPMLDHPINGHISDIKLYERKARAWTRRYASTPVASYYLEEKGDENWEDYCDAIAAHNAELEKKERRREADRLRAAAAAASAEARRRKVASPREKGVSLLWRRTVAFLQGRRPVASPSTVKAV